MILARKCRKKIKAITNLFTFCRRGSGGANQPSPFDPSPVRQPIPRREVEGLNKADELDESCEVMIPLNKKMYGGLPVILSGHSSAEVSGYDSGATCKAVTKPLLPTIEDEPDEDEE